MRAVTYIEIDVPEFVQGSPSGETQTFRFAMPSADLDPSIEAIPSIENISFTPQRLSLGENLGQRASLTVNFRDHRHIFNGEPYSQGTFWGKWRGRYGTKLRGCPVRLIRGEVGQTIADMETRHYMVDNTDGPNPSGVYTIVARDLLKFADDDRAQAPLVSNGSLAGSINNSTTTASLSPVGIGDEEYPTSGYVCIGGKEVCAFTRSGDTLTITRGQFGSVAQTHDAGDRVQICIRYTGNDVADIIYDLLVNYANVPSDYINLTEWQEETLNNLGAILYSATLSEPTSVRKLLNELIEQAALAVYWDDRAQRIRLVVLREISTDTDTFTQDRIIEGTLKVQEQPGKRISQIWTFYGERDPTDRGADEDNFRAALADVDLALETEYGSAEIKKITARWIETEQPAARLNAITMSRFRNPPRSFAFDLPRTEAVTPAAGYTLRWWANQNELGEEQPALIQITQVSILPDRIHIEAEEMLASGELPVLLNVVFLTQTGAVRQWEVPATWNDADNSVELIGGGGGGAGFQSRGAGAGGGAYSKVSNIDMTPGASVNYFVGRGGASDADGEGTWFGGSSYGTSTVAAQGGFKGVGRAGPGSGGQASAGIGSVRFSGGNGGQAGPSGDSGTAEGGGGGGGAAGPHGNGGGGGANVFTQDDGGAGGGGADGGSAGSQTSSSSGGAGGANRFNFGGGSPGNSGSEGGGGGGSGRDSGSPGGPGGAGEQLWTQTVAPITAAGPGGGGGGGGRHCAGGVGGLYGGGGGGCGNGQAGGAGAQGIIVITWREAE